MGRVWGFALLNDPRGNRYEGSRSRDIKDGVHMEEITADSMDGSFDDDKGRKRDSLFGKFNARIHDAIQTNRGETGPSIMDTLETTESRATGEATSSQAQPVAPQRMIVPEGVVIEGAMRSNSETEIAGRVEGAVTVEGHLKLARTGTIAGEVKAAHCSLNGKVEGNVDCADELHIGVDGQLHADAVAGKLAMIAGTVNGNVNCAGRVQLTTSATVNGNIRARSLSIAEGATFNGECSMTTPKKR